MTGLPRDGTVALSSTAGTFTYTPTLGARLRAGSTANADVDSFTVTVTDGTATNDVPVTVTVPVAPTFWVDSASVPVGHDASGVAIAANRAFVTNQSDGTVTVIDTRTNGVVATVTVGSAPSAIAVNPAGTRAYVANGGSGTVSVISTATNTVIATIAVGRGPSGIAVNPGGTLVYVTNAADNSVSKISTSSNKVTGTVIAVGARPSSIAFSRDGAYVMVTNADDGSTSYFATSATSAKAIAAVGTSPISVIPGVRSNLWYVSSRGGEMALVDTKTSTVTLIDAPGSHDGSAVDKAGTQVAVVNDDGSVSIVDTATNTIAQTVDQTVDDARPASIAFASDGTRLYVTDPVNARLRVLSLVAAVPGNHNPVALAPSLGAPDSSSGATTVTLPVRDTDGDRPEVSLSSAPARGTLIVDYAAPGTFSATYTPTAAARHAAATGAAGLGTDTFSVTVTDPRGGVVTVPLVVSIDAANVAPVTQTKVGAPSAYYGTVTGSIQATDADADKLTYAGSTKTAKGTVTVTSTGSFTYRPTAAARHDAARSDATARDRTDTFDITVDDGHGGRVAVPVTVDVSPTNAALRATATIEKPDSTTGAVTGKVTASDADRDVLTYTATTTHTGTVVLDASGGFTYTPTETARLIATVTPLTDTFTITVDDGHGATKAFALTTAVAPKSPASVDSTAALQAAFDDLKPGDTLTLAPGVYRYGNVLRINTSGITLNGNGATLEATNPAAAALQIIGDDITVSNLKLTAPINQSRVDDTDRVRLLYGGNGFTLTDVSITGGTSAGVYLVNAGNFHLTRVTVSDTGADGVQITGDSHDGQLDGVTTNRTGDDGIGIVSYESSPHPVRDVVVNSPVVNGTTQGRGLAVVGGERITFNDITVSGTSGAGVYIGSYSGAVDTSSTRDIVVNGGTITGTNVTPFPFGAVKIDSRNPNQTVANVTVSNLTIENIDSRQDFNITVTVGGNAPTWYEALATKPAGTLDHIVFHDIDIVQTQRRGIIWTNSPGSYYATGFTVNGAPVAVSGSTPPAVNTPADRR